MKEPTSVEARFAEDGRVTVRSFTWRGQRRPVVSQGRQWQAEDGRHCLVMAPGDEVFELVFAPETGAWQVVSQPGPQTA